MDIETQALVHWFLQFCLLWSVAGVPRWLSVVEAARLGRWFPRRMIIPAALVVTTFAHALWLFGFSGANENELFIAKFSWVMGCFPLSLAVMCSLLSKQPRARIRATRWVREEGIEDEIADAMARRGYRVLASRRKPGDVAMAFGRNRHRGEIASGMLPGIEQAGTKVLLARKPYWCVVADLSGETGDTRVLTVTFMLLDVVTGKSIESGRRWAAEESAFLAEALARSGWEVAGS